LTLTESLLKTPVSPTVCHSSTPTTRYSRPTHNLRHD